MDTDKIAYECMKVFFKHGRLGTLYIMRKYKLTYVAAAKIKAKAILLIENA